MNNIIEISNLTKKYGTARGITDLNISVKSGDFFGFMGPNGAGKSTTIRLLLGLIKKTSGEIKTFGKDHEKHQVELRKNIGYMPSEAMFYPNMTVKEVIQLSAKLHKKECSEVSNKLCELLQLDKKRRIQELSLGNRKKVSIICAMQHEPELYILDEPTSGLDPLMQKAFFDLLLERNKAGATIFLSSHILSEIQKYCNNVAVVKEGRLITIDTVEHLSKTKSKKIKITGKLKLPMLQDCTELNETEEGISFLYKGELPKLISALNGLPIKDINIEDQSLDEIFMHFYEKEDN